MFLVTSSGRRAGLPDASELDLLRRVLRAVVDADDRRALHPAELTDEQGICVLELGGDPAAPGVTVTREQWDLSESAEAIPFPSFRPDLGDVAHLPRLDATWLIGMPPLPVGIQGDDRTLNLLLVVDDASELVIQGQPIMAGELAEAMEILTATFHGQGMGGRKGLPGRVVFASRRLHDALAPVLEQAGVKCEYRATLPKLQGVLESFVAHLGPGTSRPRRRGEAPRARRTEVPAPGDLVGWKAADGRLNERMSEHLVPGGRDRFNSTRAVKRYFGEDDLGHYLSEHRQRMVAEAYLAWIILDYRPTRASKTLAEQMLKQGLAEAEAMLLRAYPAGRFRFIEPAGPPLGPMMGSEATAFLQDCDMAFTPEGIRQDVHKFGWLWSWMEQWQSKQSTRSLCNTDGEAFVWHTASFSVADPQATKEILLGRDDIDYDDPQDEFVWSKETGPDNKMIGDTVTLGRIEFVADELVLTVNSARRLATARAWLEVLPGVTFLDVQTRAWDEAEEDRPLDERIAGLEPVEITPDMKVAIQAMMDKRYMEWINASLPTLDHQTPRQACRTEAGRQRVATLIRTIPDPTGPAPVRVPREVMLRELGLPVGATAVSAPGPGRAEAIDIQAIGPKNKVGRNAPCPCGSGRKYKKCCGGAAISHP
ncbi:MAG: SEC-C domain-containing protein [Planctomycetes bacterium]|nr:SEC-C domain-containing protein [Planctomycetota bacterium]